MPVHVVEAGGKVIRSFEGATMQEELHAAAAWRPGQDAIPAAARNLLHALTDVQEMLEETDDSGRTAEAFAALEDALASWATS